jgi:hypothetical protein
VTPKQRKGMLLRCAAKAAYLKELRDKARYREERRNLKLPANDPPPPDTIKPKPSTYEKYIRSAHWKAFCITVRAKRGIACERCGSTRNTQIHHKTYKRLFNELLEDVELLCNVCHEIQHGIR